RWSLSVLQTDKTTSTGVRLRSVTPTNIHISHNSALTDAHGQGPSSGRTHSNASQIWLTVQAGSMMWHQDTLRTLSIITATPLRMKKKARLNAPATTLHFT